MSDVDDRIILDLDQRPAKTVTPREEIAASVNPAHYASLGLYSAVHVIARWGLGYLLGNTVKYIQRAGKKPGQSELQDLLKAQWYLARRIHELDPDEPDPAA